jgi:hypothetical protein
MRGSRGLGVSSEDLKIISVTFMGVASILALAYFFGNSRSGLEWSREFNRKSFNPPSFKYRSQSSNTARARRAAMDKMDEFDAMKCMSGPWNTCLPKGVQSF